jgi:glycosyltransferase involved in cell wall biosynthesis
MTSRLRIALTVDPYIPVQPVTYGGIERVLAALIEELTSRGHEITLFAHPGSRTVASHVPYGSPPHFGFRARATELWQVGSALWSRRRHFDVVHSFGRLAALFPVLLDHTLAKVQSYQREIPWQGVNHGSRLGGSSLSFTACSSSMWQGHAHAAADRWTTVYNGVDLGVYDATDNVDADAPLVFLGRIERIKGTHSAIEIARRANRRLIIAGNQVASHAGREYFAREVQPHIDGRRVSYVGPVDDAAKNRLLGSAAALLMPIEWEEPFGIVMAEAMACGTPVIGFARGSVPEVVEPGITGAIVADVPSAGQAVDSVCLLDRRRVRSRCAERFGYAVIADAYERVYDDALRRLGQGWQRAG